MNRTDKKTDSQLDQLDLLIATTDESLTTDGMQACRLTGADVRRHASRRQTNRSQRRRALSGVIVLAIGMFGWRFLMPENSIPVVDQVESIQSTPNNTKQLLAEVERLREQRRMIEGQLQLLDSKKRLKQVGFAIQDFSRETFSPEMTFERNRNTWNSLMQIALWNQERQPDGISESNRWQLEMLVDGFPDTEAAGVARTMLTNNHIPDTLF